MVPTLWYAICQSYIPYNNEGLNGTHIIREALQKLVTSASEFEEEGSEKQYRRRVWQLLVEMRGDQKWYSLRFGCWLLSYIFKWLFNGEIFVGDEVLAQLRAMAPTSTFVYVLHPGLLVTDSISAILPSSNIQSQQARMSSVCTSA